MKKIFTLFILVYPLMALAQPIRQVTGRVIDDADGSPLAGATVFIDPAQVEYRDYNPQGTAADAEGNFTLAVPTGVTKVVVSFLGYDAITADITGRTHFTFRLKQDTQDIETVVVTGYQRIEKRKLTSSIETVDMADINQIGVASVDQMLAGQIAGLYVAPTTGAPGAGAKIQVRSNVTLQGNTDPLWVLDGMPLEGNEIPADWNNSDGIGVLYSMSIAGLNPADIENITVLKDAAATAIYGARAANGVIVVTTKRGAKNTPTRVNASASLFVTGRPNIDKLNLLNASQKVDLELQLAQNGRHDYFSGWGAVARILDTANEREKLLNGGFSALDPGTQAAIDKLRTSGIDWAKEIYRPTLNQQYSVSLSGGSDKVTYYVSGGYYNEQGTTRQTGFERLNLTMKTDWEIIENLRFGASVFVGQNKQKTFNMDKYAYLGPVKYTRTVNPYLEAFDEKGNYIYDPDVNYQVGSSTHLDYNYFEERDNSHNEMTTKSVKTIFDLEYKPLAGLSLLTQFGLQYDDSNTERAAEKNTFFTRWYNEQSRVDKTAYLPDGGVIENFRQDMDQYTWKIQGQYNRRFAQKHEMDFMAGLELRQDKRETFLTRGFGYSSKTLRTVSITFPDTDAGVQRANSNLFRPYEKKLYENRYVSYYMTGSYTYDNRYTFFGSLRYDGTNLFGVDRKYKYTPLWSVSGMYNLKQEQFMQSVHLIDNLRLRGSYGIQGNVDRTTSPYVVGTWNYSTVGGTPEDRIMVLGAPNRNLRWETTAMWNAAIELGVLDSRLGVVLERYGTRSKNLITMQYLPLETGFQSSMTNFGEVHTDGWELSIHSVNIRSNNFTWETSLNIARNKDKVKKIQIDENSYMPSREGHSVNSAFVVQTAGLDKNGLPKFVRNGKEMGIVDYFNFRVNEDVWGYQAQMDNSYSDMRNWFTNIGTRDPKFTGGINNRFRYKGFDLTIAANFVIKRKVSRTPFYNPSEVNPGINYTTEMLDVWSPDNPGGKYPAITGGSKEDGSSWGSGWDEYDELRVWDFILNSPNSSLMWNNLDIWTKNMSFLRINSIRLGYTLPSEISRKLHLASVRFSAEARNPFVVSTSYKYYLDPETYGNIYAQPVARTVSFGIQVSF